MASSLAMSARQLGGGRTGRAAGSPPSGAVVPRPRPSSARDHRSGTNSSAARVDPRPNRASWPLPSEPPCSTGLRTWLAPRRATLPHPLRTTDERGGPDPSRWSVPSERDGRRAGDPEGGGLDGAPPLALPRLGAPRLGAPRLDPPRLGAPRRRGPEPSLPRPYRRKRHRPVVGLDGRHHRWRVSPSYSPPSGRPVCRLPRRSRGALGPPWRSASCWRWACCRWWASCGPEAFRFHFGHLWPAHRASGPDLMTGSSRWISPGAANYRVFGGPWPASVTAVARSLRPPTDRGVDREPSGSVGRGVHRGPVPPRIVVVIPLPWAPMCPYSSIPLRAARPAHRTGCRAG